MLSWYNGLNTIN